MKSESKLSSSSPTGVSREIGSRETFLTAFTFFSSQPRRSAISASVGSLPKDCNRDLDSLTTLLICSIMCTGTRIVLAWSEIERVIACLIHQVAYVENLKPFLYSNFSTALIRPILPSCTRSKKCKPLLVYFLAIDTTSLRLALMRRSLASFIIF